MLITHWSEQMNGFLRFKLLVSISTVGKLCNHGLVRTQILVVYIFITVVNHKYIMLLSEGKSFVFHFQTNHSISDNQHFLNFLDTIPNYVCECNRFILHEKIVLDPKVIIQNTNSKIWKIVQHPSIVNFREFFFKYF